MYVLLKLLYIHSECRPRTTCADDTNLGYRATRITGNDAISVGEVSLIKIPHCQFQVFGMIRSGTKTWAVFTNHSKYHSHSL